MQREELKHVCVAFYFTWTGVVESILNITLAGGYVSPQSSLYMYTAFRVGWKVWDEEEKTPDQWRRSWRNGVGDDTRRQGGQ